MNFLASSALLLLIVAPVSCKKDKTPGTSNCINRKIQTLEKETVRNPPASVVRYTYAGKTVYYIPPYCCDNFSELYDEDCNLICAPDGGFSGVGDGHCTDFWTTATNPVEIWRDPR